MVESISENGLTENSMVKVLLSHRMGNKETVNGAAGRESGGLTSENSLCLIV